MRYPSSGLVLSALLLALSVSLHAAPADDWPSYGADAASTKYADFSQINVDNVSSIEMVWSWASPDNLTVASNHEQQNYSATPGNYKVTPIAVDGVLYVSTSLGKVAAIDGVSGEQLWVFDTRSWEQGRPANLGYNHRGVSYWRSGDQARILMPGNDAMLWSLDAST